MLPSTSNVSRKVFSIRFFEKKSTAGDEAKIRTNTEVQKKTQTEWKFLWNIRGKEAKEWKMEKWKERKSWTKRKKNEDDVLKNGKC